ncbi:Ig-like domain-containing protein [Corallococcus interemptor]|uniref:Ig-like domain-containing protein n=1 Tax=Corallococcus interemptor TaxID=2316720 RepID=UPI0035D4A32E
MSMVSRRARRLAVALVGAGAWVSAGCGELPAEQENTPSQVRPVDGAPEETSADGAEHGLVIQDAAVLDDPARTAPEAEASPAPRQQEGALLLDDTTPPAVAISSPTPASFLRGTFVVTANASDDVGVARVDFYDGTTLIGSSFAAPFSVSWDTTSATSGNRTLTAQAFDAAGNATTSSAVTAMVDNYAPVIITGVPQYNPTSQNYVRGLVTVGWAVTDQGLSGVALTEFLQEGIVKATAPGTSSYTYNFTWDTRVLANRAYTLAIRATDKAGNVQTSSRSLTVDNVPPSALLFAPTNGAVVSGDVTLSASASDTQAMLQVIFEIDGVATFFAGASPYTRTWNTAGLSGTHTIVAIAYDRAGNSRRSNAVTVTVP